MAAKLFTLLLALTAASADCPAGCVCETENVCDHCVAGYEWNSGSCNGCPPNRYCPGGFDPNQACYVCPSGTYQAALCTGATDTVCPPCTTNMPHCSTCSGANVCTLCDDGYYWSSGSCTACVTCTSATTCIQGTCGLGTYCPRGVGSDTCSTCPSGKYCTGGVAQPTTCNVVTVGNPGYVANCNCYDYASTPNCVGCSPKYYLSGGSCSACISGCAPTKRPFDICFGTRSASCQPCQSVINSACNSPPADYWPPNIATICAGAGGTVCPRADNIINPSGVYTLYPLQP